MTNSLLAMSKQKLLPECLGHRTYMWWNIFSLLATSSQSSIGFSMYNICICTLHSCRHACIGYAQTLCLCIPVWCGMYALSLWSSEVGTCPAFRDNLSKQCLCLLQHNRLKEFFTRPCSDTFTVIKLPPLHEKIWYEPYINMCNGIGSYFNDSVVGKTC